MADELLKPGDKKSAKATSKEDEQSVLATARKRARDGATYWSDNWKAAEDDLLFLSGEQWPATVKNDRELTGRPCITNNVLPTFVDQVLGDQRQNRPAIKVSPVDSIRVMPSGGDKPTDLKIANTAGTQDYGLAEVFTGLIKNIEYNCDAETSYDIAFQSAVESGMGFLRVRSDYLSDETFDQDIIIGHIEDQFSVTIDPSAKERDKSDMNWCLIDDVMEKSQFEKLYPDANTDPVGSEGDQSTWFAENTVRVSEYFTREPVVKVVYLLSDGRTVYKDEIEPVLDELEAKGIEIKRERKVNAHKVYWRKITGLNVLEGPIEVKCSTIPVVPVWGKALTIKQKTMFRSIIRHSKDAQRMANYWDSAATESVALAPKAPFIGSEGHVEGYETQWSTANTSNSALLTYVPQYQGDPGPRREQPSAVPAAEITLAMNSTDKIKSTLGMYDASMGAQGNETSGKAIVARQRQGDRGSFTFIDNLTKAIRRVGKICVEMIPHIYDTERVVRLKFTDESEDFVKLNEQILDEQTNKWVTINDLGVSKYDVVVTTGPAYSTQRVEAAESLMAFAQAVPAAAGVIADLIAQNLDFPGADIMAERLKKIVPPEVLTAEERETIAKDQPAQKEPTPEQQIQMAELDVRGKEVEADNMKAQADIAKAETELVKAQLQSAEAQAKLQVINTGAANGDQAYMQVKQLVAQAMAELMQGNQAINAQ